MDASILNTIKKMLGLEADYTPFDTDIMIHINSALMVLRQLGVGPDSGFAITGPNETWSDFIGTDQTLEALKAYIYLRVKSVFDPPQSSVAMEAMQNQIDEYTWRLNVAVDPSQNLK